MKLKKIILVLVCFSLMFSGVAFPGHSKVKAAVGYEWGDQWIIGDVSHFWTCIASDADGSTLVAGDVDGRMYVSTNSGATWVKRQPLEAAITGDGWVAVASNADGTRLEAVSLEGL